MRVDDRIPVLVGHLEQQVVADDAGARDEDVQMAQLLHRARDHRLHRVTRAHVACDRESADGLRHLARRSLIQIRHHHPRAFGRKKLSRRRADAARASRHDGDSILEPHVVVVSSAVPPSLRGSDAPTSRSPAATITCGLEKYES